MPPARQQHWQAQQRSQAASQPQQQLWTFVERLPEDCAKIISKLAHEMSQRECIRQLSTALRRRAARIYKQKRDVLMNMDDDHPRITTAREEVLYYHALAVGLDVSRCWEVARIWPDELEILHCLPDLV